LNVPRISTVVSERAGALGRHSRNTQRALAV
jgi:hypothetical protein